MRHLGQVRDHGRALGIATKGELQRTALDVGQNVAKGNVLPASIGNLDSNQRCPRNGGEDTHRIGSKRQGDIVLKIGDAAHALALAGLHLKGGDRGAGDPSDHARVKAKLL